MPEGSGTWSHFAHGSDIGVRGEGPAKEDAFAQAAVALTGVLTDPARVEARQAVEIRCSAPDDELLLMDWLNALIYEMATRRMIFARFEIRLGDEKDGVSLRAVAWGETVDVARHRPAVEVKGATCSGLRVAHADGKWIAECIVDV